jgi:hypothetical protein
LLYPLQRRFGGLLQRFCFNPPVWEKADWLVRRKKKTIDAYTSPMRKQGRISIELLEQAFALERDLTASHT